MAAMEKRMARNRIGEICFKAACTRINVEPQMTVFPARAASARQVRAAAWFAA